MKKIIAVIVIALTLASCWPEGCWDCRTYSVDGELTEVCEQLDDSYCE